MARTLSALTDHPISYSEAMRRGLVRAVCLRVIDGDTADFLLDLGWLTYAHARVRLYGVDTPELRGTTGAKLAKARRATHRLEQLVRGRPALLRSYKDRRTFDRFVAEVFVPAGRARAVERHALVEGGGPWWSVADVLVAEKLAVTVYG